MAYYTLEEVAEMLKVSLSMIENLVKTRQLGGIKVGHVIRIRDVDLDRFAVGNAIGGERPRNGNGHESPTSVAAGDASLGESPRLCWSIGGRKQFRVRGSVAKGAEIWPGQMRYPIRFSKAFMSELLSHFRNQEVRIGGKFDDAGPGSLGQFIQKKLEIKMNPAVYLAGLLADEGFVERTKRGYIRFRTAN